PVISYFLSKAGMLTPGFLKEYRRQAIIACLLIAAFLTPPDPVSQMMIAIPLVLLYQLAIVVSRMANRQREKILNEAFSDNGNEPES
ncbi:MAG: twin-arginine translocase subunit TatC, partial [Balneolaceae bacterium]